MRFIGISLVSLGTPVVSVFSGNSLPVSFGLFAIIFGFMMFLEDVIENPRNK